MKALKYRMIFIVILVTFGISLAVVELKQLAKVDDFVIEMELQALKLIENTSWKL